MSGASLFDRHLPHFSSALYMQGRFAGILPATPPTDIEAEVARKVLRSFGINPDGTRVNPSLN